MHLWSVSYKEDGLFDFWRESNITIIPDFDDKTMYLTQLVKFCWNAKVINIGECIIEILNHLNDSIYSVCWKIQ